MSAAKELHQNLGQSPAIQM